MTVDRFLFHVALGRVMDIAGKKRRKNSLGKLRDSILLCVSERNCLDFGLRVVDYYMQIQGTALERPVCSLRVIQSVNMIIRWTPSIEYWTMFSHATHHFIVLAAHRTNPLGSPLCSL
jgi:hypothetical protein